MVTRSEMEDEHFPEATATCRLLSETYLVECLRSADASDGAAAVRELQRRHVPAVVGYAQLYTAGRPADRQLADEAFFHAVEEVRDGVDPSGTWRHHVLTHVREAACVWAADGRRERLRPDFLAWARTADPAAGPEPPNVMIGAFYQLPERLRSALWYAVVDDEPHSEVAANLGISPDAVPDLAAKAQVAMQDAYMQEHLSRHGTAECRGFNRIVEAAAQARDGYRHPDLAAHLAHCIDCGVLLSGLARLSESPRTPLAEGLLMWGGAAYAERVPTHKETGPPEQSAVRLADDRRNQLATSAAVVEASKRPGSLGHAHRFVPGHRAVTAVGGIAAAVAVGAVVAVVAAYDALPEGWNASGLVRPQPSRSADPSPSSAPSRPAAGTPSGDGAPAPGGTPPPAPVRVGVAAQIVHTATGLCLDVENQVVQKRVNAVAAPCGAGATQRWTFDKDGHLHNAADPAFCLKVDGDATGVGIRPCSSDNPEKRARMTFAIGENGAIQSKPRAGQVIVPVGTSTGEPLPLVLKESSAAGAQQWAARSVAVTGSPSPAAG
ncbi:ricin-type beta-trefoil lectin domain protein [Streptomyces sp. HNM0663]|uniref:Ricin-type beta-trefoil lectin domain protein n=1 Tax=Streptomyces chengmaiensis TaxID=3040919 RepID=A0ABT6HIH6_9ACTN|nr:ricin-type beta-trefoil lectin domain protein [Streptomyces chengmaiensis]MDH2387849.1 ricin-type beta-trefoil lectin domain protein [Streptomyces chengmaiensis]